ncbi:hypothetical protein ACH5RR_011252 [Cinchona calisaya]|uniref:Ninja-family protein n=1 Tax=Cinchona calisaya TaxID=153742 RepID=A0ABD3A4B9_9GENT
MHAKYVVEAEDDRVKEHYMIGMKSHENNAEEEEEEVELSLGLSLNGKFGVDPKKTNMKLLMRCSSVSPFMLAGDGGGGERHVAPMPIAAAYAPLKRTCSLPAETEEGWRKRKELQSLRRMEAKRRRMDKIKFVRVVERDDEVDLVDNSGQENGTNLPINTNGHDDLLDNINGNGYNHNMLPSSQGSIGSHGSASSGLSEFETQSSIQVNKTYEVRSPSSVQSRQVQNGQKPLLMTEGAKEVKDMLKNIMLDMPCVSTIGNGPNGKRIEGFLYRYRKGEEVKIMCVCHGSFLSPAEFVKHAGGTEVEHPLRHIVVKPSPFL